MCRVIKGTGLYHKEIKSVLCKIRFGKKCNALLLFLRVKALWEILMNDIISFNRCYGGEDMNAKNTDLKELESWYEKSGNH